MDLCPKVFLSLDLGEISLQEKQKQKTISGDKQGFKREDQTER